MSNGLVIDTKTTLSISAFIGFADKPDFIRIPFIPITEEQPNIKWSFTVQALIPFQSSMPLPDPTPLPPKPIPTDPTPIPPKPIPTDPSPFPPDSSFFSTKRIPPKSISSDPSYLKNLASQPSDDIIIRPIQQFATINLNVNVLREADGLLFTIDRSGSNVPDWENVFVTMVAMKADNSSGHTFFNDVLGSPDEPARIARFPLAAVLGPIPDEPDPSSIPFQDFTSSIADSIKKAQEQIQSKLGNELFGLDLENFEIKTPYVVNINSKNELIMTKPPAEPVGNYEPAFSKLTFRKTIKLE